MNLETLMFTCVCMTYCALRVITSRNPCMRIVSGADLLQTAGSGVAGASFWR